MSLLHVWNDLRGELPAALLGTHHNCLAFRAAPALAGAAITHIASLSSTWPFEHFEAISVRHQVADLLANSPRGFISHAEPALKFLAANAVARRDEQVDCIEPRLERRAAVLKDRSGAGVDVSATCGAGECPAASDLMKCAFDAAFSTDMAQAVADFHDAVKAGVIILELRKEVANRESLNGAFFLASFRRTGAFVSSDSLHLHEETMP